MGERPPAAAFPSTMRADAHLYLERLDDACQVAGDAAHHLVRVKRVRAGGIVTGADGHGRWRAYEVGSASGDVVALGATTGLFHEPRLVPSLTLACSLVKGQRPELTVQKLTELGVDGVVFVQAARSVVRWDEARAATAIARLQRVAREAGVQSRRARLPTIEGPMSVTELALVRDLVVTDPDGVSASALPDPATGSWVVAVGPEGGFDRAEVEQLSGAARLALGPNVLRAETAAIAAAAALAGRRSPAASPGNREEW